MQLIIYQHLTPTIISFSIIRLFTEKGIACWKKRKYKPLN